MEDIDGEIHVDSDDARAGSTNNAVRWVLGIGLLLAVVAMSAAWLIPALSRGGETKNVNVSRQIVSEQRSDGTGTDSIVGDSATLSPEPAASETATATATTDTAQ